MYRKSFVKLISDKQNFVKLNVGTFYRLKTDFDGDNNLFGS